METLEPPAVELIARPLRPVARWTRVTDESGRTRLEMVWAVPDPDADLARHGLLRG
jgi:hypothetical protein